MFCSKLKEETQHSRPLRPQGLTNACERQACRLTYYVWLFEVSWVTFRNYNKQVQLLSWHTLISNFSSAGKMFFSSLMSHNVDYLLLHWVVSLTLCGPLHRLRPSSKPGENERERKTRPALKALNNLLSQFSNNLNQFDVLSNKICCCTPLSAAPWMPVNLHFLIKLARIFIRGLGYANGNVVYSRLTEFCNKFNRETFGVRKKKRKKWVIVFNFYHADFSWGSQYSKEPCQGRVLLSNEVISIALSTEETHSFI